MRILACIVLVFLASQAGAGEAGAVARLQALEAGSSFEVAQAFDCRRKTCPQMVSCAEACYKLTVCGDRRRDGDNDGIPCENICSRPCR